ncbi:AcrR family transcriptional regulator [Streptomyces canus]|uniref:AcrR family transcriptional regulator n=1 Tax=Streptomyces canus TaxID=58343 RepID=A0AAW8F8V4_9ACTN|nr:AcrR family transcriptional regulator [Streptomyces canus]
MVAKEAGVGPGTLYRHFPTREALLAAVLLTRSEELVARQADIDQVSPMSSRQSGCSRLPSGVTRARACSTTSARTVSYA